MKLLIITMNKFPDGDAGAIRQMAEAKILQKYYDDIFVIGYGDCTNFQKVNFSEGKYISLRENGVSMYLKIRGRLFFNRRARQEMNVFKPDTILVIDIPTKLLRYIKKYASERNIQLIHDSVEWYSPEQFKLGIFSPTYIKKDLLNKKKIDNQFSVIAISTYLEKHFKLKKCNVIKLPVIMDIEKISYEKNINYSKLTLIYAGSPGKKDYLDLIIEALTFLEEKERDKIELRIIGISEKFLKKCGITEKNIHIVKNSIKCLGKISRDEVLEQYKEADFSVLLRSETLRYAKAGFPTKVVESLACGTPIICNLSSDLSEYLVDMKNSILVENCTSKSFAKSLHKAILLNEYDRKNLSIEARKTAENNFDYRLFNEKVKRWLSYSTE